MSSLIIKTPSIYNASLNNPLLNLIQLFIRTTSISTQCSPGDQKIILLTAFLERCPFLGLIGGVLGLEAVAATGGIGAAVLGGNPLTGLGNPLAGLVGALLLPVCAGVKVGAA